MEIPSLEQFKESWKEKENPFAKARNERDELLMKFQAKINEERKGTEYKPMSFMAIKIKLTHLDDWDLKMFYETCNNSLNFSRCFFGKLKVK
jgi:hypothetical protein